VSTNPAITVCFSAFSIVRSELCLFYRLCSREALLSFRQGSCRAQCQLRRQQVTIFVTGGTEPNRLAHFDCFWILFILAFFFLPLPVGSLEMKHLGLVENVFYCFYWWCWVAIKGGVSWGKASGWSRALCSFLECSVMEQVEEVN